MSVKGDSPIFADTKIGTVPHKLLGNAYDVETQYLGAAGIQRHD
jgi:hypothetical protein